jgi:hypothetical protein
MPVTLPAFGEGPARYWLSEREYPHYPASVPSTSQFGREGLAANKVRAVSMSRNCARNYINWREADAYEQLPAGNRLLLLDAFRIRRLGLLVCILRVLLGLGRVLLALGVVILAVRLGRGAMGLRRVFVMLGSLVVCVFHCEFPWLADIFRLTQIWALIVAVKCGNGG